jgi:putative transposase
VSERANPYCGFHVPAEVISHAVWLYARFALSYRDVEELLAERGIQVRYESVRRWANRFGEEFADKLRDASGAPSASGTWTRCSCASAESSATCGVPSMRTGKAF